MLRKILTDAKSAKSVISPYPLPFTPPPPRSILTYPIALSRVLNNSPTTLSSSLKLSDVSIITQCSISHYSSRRTSAEA